jgi:hypothetical protein
MTLRERFDGCIWWDFHATGLDVDYRIEKAGPVSRVFLRGTESLQDVLLDAKFQAVQYDRGFKVHRGIAEGYASARDKLLAELADAPAVEVQGWSLGAAYALLLHYDLQFRVAVRGFGFGTPAILWGTPKVVRARFGQFTRITLRGDPFAQGWLPPRLLGYQHAGREVTIGEPAPLDAFARHGDITAYQRELDRLE